METLYTIDSLFQALTGNDTELLLFSAEPLALYILPHSCTADLIGS